MWYRDNDHRGTQTERSAPGRNQNTVPSANEPWTAQKKTHERDNRQTELQRDPEEPNCGPYTRK
jgi:hypothetical protein